MNGKGKRKNLSRPNPNPRSTSNSNSKKRKSKIVIQDDESEDSASDDNDTLPEPSGLHASKAGAGKNGDGNKSKNDAGPRRNRTVTPSAAEPKGRPNRPDQTRVVRMIEESAELTCQSIAGQVKLLIRMASEMDLDYRKVQSQEDTAVAVGHLLSKIGRNLNSALVVSGKATGRTAIYHCAASCIQLTVEIFTEGKFRLYPEIPTPGRTSSPNMYQDLVLRYSTRKACAEQMFKHVTGGLVEHHGVSPKIIVPSNMLTGSDDARLALQTAWEAELRKSFRKAKALNERERKEDMYGDFIRLYREFKAVSDFMTHLCVLCAIIHLFQNNGHLKPSTLLNRIEEICLLGSVPMPSGSELEEGAGGRFDGDMEPNDVPSISPDEMVQTLDLAVNCISDKHDVDTNTLEKACKYITDSVLPSLVRPLLSKKLPSIENLTEATHSLYSGSKAASYGSNIDSISSMVQIVDSLGPTHGKLNALPSFPFRVCYATLAYMFTSSFNC